VRELYPLNSFRSEMPNLVLLREKTLRFGQAWKGFGFIPGLAAKATSSLCPVGSLRHSCNR
jgi:hypothetical protein